MKSIKAITEFMLYHLGLSEQSTGTLPVRIGLMDDAAKAFSRTAEGYSGTTKGLSQTAKGFSRTATGYSGTSAGCSCTAKVHSGTSTGFNGTATSFICTAKTFRNDNKGSKFKKSIFLINN